MGKGERGAQLPQQGQRPARLLGAAAGRALLRYVETRALVGGTTCVQGNPKGGTPRDGELVRNIDSERLGTSQDFIRVRTIVADTLDDLEDVIKAVGQRRGFIYHTAEGTDPTLRDEFALLVQAKLVRKELMMIHGSALTTADFQRLAGGDATLVWSPPPTCGCMAPPPTSPPPRPSGSGSVWDRTGRRRGPATCCGNSRSPSCGTSANRRRCSPTRNWSGWLPPTPARPCRGCGRIRLAASNPAPWATWWSWHRATPTPSATSSRPPRLTCAWSWSAATPATAPARFMAAAGAATATLLQVGCVGPLDYGDASVTWAKVLAELDGVRKDLAAAADRAADAPAAFVAAGPTAPDAPLVLLPDMPAPKPTTPSPGRWPHPNR